MRTNELECSAAYQNAVGEFVARHVHACASSLVYELCQKPDVCEDIYEAGILSQTTWTPWVECACGAYLEGHEYADENDAENAYGDLIAATCRKCGARYADPITGEVHKAGIEENQNEALEHWIISRDLMRWLSERGEMTGELYGLPIWGRACSGQAILLDSVICDIYDHLHRGK